MDCWKKRKKNKEGTLKREAEQTLKRGAELLEDLIGCCDGKSNPIKIFSADEICKGTDNFSDSNNISELSTDKNHCKILIKKIAPRPRFHGQVQWHSGPSYIGALSIGSIILDEDGIAKLINFCLCVSIPQGETFVKVDRLAGTLGYLDNNYLMKGIVSEETDIFAIGVLMQRLLIGKERFLEILETKDGEEEEEEANGEGDDVVDSFDFATLLVMNNPIKFSERRLQWRLLKFVEEQRIDEIADPKMLENIGENLEEELCQMKSYRMLSQRCIECRGKVPTMVEVVKELKKIQRSLKNDSSSFSSSSSSGETQFDSALDILSSIHLSNQT